MSKQWHTLSLAEVKEALKASVKTGLSEEEAQKRLEKNGPNELVKESDGGIIAQIIQQFKSPLVFILAIAGVVTFLLHEYLDSIVIAIALLINIIVGTFQEERASKAFEKLNESQEKYAIVFRNGMKKKILARELVVGDIVLLEGGFNVPADIRIVEAKDLKVNEAVLTGEWASVSKKPGEVASDVPLAERYNMAWMGTLIASGYGRGIVVAVAEKTQVGAIAAELGTIEQQVTPLQENIRSVAKFLTYVIAAALVVIFVLGLSRGEPLAEMIVISIAIAVATIPSGLPAAVTVVLAIGMEAILKRGGLVRNLLAAETLGSTTVILTDKTGTLTEARMKLAEVHTYESFGQTQDRSEWTKDDHFLLESAVLASDAFVEETKGEEGEQKLTVQGRPVEKAIVLGGLESGISQDEIITANERIDYLQFSSERKFSASLNTVAGKDTNRVHINGAPEILLERAEYLYKEGRKIKFAKNLKGKFLELMKERSQDAMRLIGVAYKDVDWEDLPEEGDTNDITRGTVFVGFMALEDPIREDVPQAIKEVRGAGARVIMITGDNPETAAAIGKRVGILEKGGEIIRGDDTEAIDDDELYDQLMNKIQVIARAAPNQKLRIARILKNHGEVVSMTGDGINDAPALRAASIGVAVGSGTEVAKEASDLVLINNSFSIIVAAIEEGRRIIDNLKKIIAYLLSTSFSEIFIIGGALIAGAPLPLLPAQILWANIVEEGLMSFSFAFEKRDPNAMKRDPRSSRAKDIMTGDLRMMIFIVSAITGIFLVALYFFLLQTDLPIEEVRTIMFVSLSLDAIFFAFSLKSLDTPLWRINFASNKFLLYALATSLGSLMLALVVPPLQRLLSLTPLTPWEILLLVFVGIFNLLTIEGAKYFLFYRRKKNKK